MSHYWAVHMGRRDHINAGCSYVFPTADAAKFFALNHKRRDPHRHITVETPAGTIIDTPLTPGEFYKRDFVAEMVEPPPPYTPMSEAQRAAVDAAAKARVRDEASRWEIPA